jgi:hypothetical protein
MVEANPGETVEVPVVSTDLTPEERMDAKLSLWPFKRRNQAAAHIAAMGVSLAEIGEKGVYWLGRTDIVLAVIVLEEREESLVA